MTGVGSLPLSYQPSVASCAASALIPSRALRRTRCCANCSIRLNAIFPLPRPAWQSPSVPASVSSGATRARCAASYRIDTTTQELSRKTFQVR